MIEVAVFDESMLRVGDDVEFEVSGHTTLFRRGIISMLCDPSTGRLFILEHRVQGPSRPCRPFPWQVRRVYRGGAEVLRKGGLTLPPVPLPVHEDSRKIGVAREFRSAQNPPVEVLRRLPNPVTRGFAVGDEISYRGKAGGRAEKGSETRAIVMSMGSGLYDADVLYCRYLNHSQSAKRPLQIKRADVMRLWRHGPLIAVRGDVLAMEEACAVSHPALYRATVDRVE